MVIDVGNDVLVGIRKISHCRFGCLHRKRRQKLVLLQFSGPCYDQARVKVTLKKPLFPSGVVSQTAARYAHDVPWNSQLRCSMLPETKRPHRRTCSART